MAAVKEEIIDDANEIPRVLNPQFVVDANQQPTAVILSIKEWNQLLDELENLDDIRACLEEERKPSERIPFEQAVAEIQAQWEK